MPWEDDGHCFVCGPRNEHGLQLHYHWNEEGSWVEGEIPSRLQGYMRTAHGGVIAAVLDDAMYYAILGQGMSTATVELKVRYRRPVETGRPFRATARCTRSTRRFAQATAELRMDGQLLAEATGTFMPPATDGSITNREAGE